jgi:N-acetylmuramoyl-L-alanine amidase
MLPEDKLTFNKLSDLETIALTIYGEARGEQWEGMIAVGFVIMNRRLIWEQGIKQVCFAPNQFSCYNSNDYQYEILLNLANSFRANLVKNVHLRKCVEAAECAMMAPLESNVYDATFYRVIGTKNRWFDNAIKKGTLIKVCEIGHHEFYKEATDE